MGQKSVWPTNTWLAQNQFGLEKKKKRQCWARISLAQQPNIRGGIIFPLSSCMQNEHRSACREEKKHESANN
jgi:hypothetical protein